jgi:hypothetical protein
VAVLGDACEEGKIKGATVPLVKLLSERSISDAVEESGHLLGDKISNKTMLPPARQQFNTIIDGWL